MRLLMTGGCGFIGANLTFALKDIGGYEVTVLDNESLGKREHIEGAGAKFVLGDIRDRELVVELMDNVDAVVHLAADTRVLDSIANPENNFDINVNGSFNIFMAMKDAGVRRIVNASTGGAILGEVEPPVHEEMPPSPLSSYGAAKLAVEGYLSAFSGSYGFKGISLRFSNVYGPRSFHKGSVVAEFYRRILAGKSLIVYGDGNQTRDFVYVDDLCTGILNALQSDRTGVFQLGTGVPVSVNDLIEMMKDVVGRKSHVNVEYKGARAGEIIHTYCDIGKARKLLDYDPIQELHNGLEKTWSWFCDQVSSA